MTNVRRKPYCVAIEVENRQYKMLKKFATFGLRHSQVADIRGSSSGSVKHLIELNSGHIKRSLEDSKAIMK